MPGIALELRGVTVARIHPATRQRAVLLSGVDWQVRTGERWAVLGPNGAGKSTLLALAAAAALPTSGSVEVLGGRLGRVHMPTLRERIGLLGTRIADDLAFWPALTVDQVVLTGLTGTTVVLHARLREGDAERAAALLERVGCAHLAGRPFAGCSDGERQRVLLARALLGEPALLVLDEPTAGLDIPGRELLLAALDRLASAGPGLTAITVVHHLEDVPSSTTHALLLRGGSVVASGAAAAVLTSGPISACFGLPLAVSSEGGRFRARLQESTV